MKRITLSLMVCCLLGTSLLAQKLTLNFSNVPMELAFVKIQTVSPYRFVYTNEQLDGTKKVSVAVRDADIKEVLRQVFKEQPVSYILEDNNIIVQKPEARAPAVKQTTNLEGRVTTAAGQPLAQATIGIKGIGSLTRSDEDGRFSLQVNAQSTLTISHIGYTSMESPVAGQSRVTIVMQPATTSLENVEVVFSTGYINTPKERATGSFVQVDNALLNRSVSTNILDRLNGVASGVLFNKNILPGTNQASISIRGRSTIFSNPNPLVILDNFPFDGDLNNINPNDIESITVLKDAAAASIWGSFSGNGVIVINTKKGSYNQAPKVSVNSNLTMTEKPDLWYQPRLSSSDYIDVEKFLYGNRNYAFLLPYAAATPVVSLLKQQTAGTISAAEAEASINSLRKQDLRYDLSRYYYRPAVAQQYALNIDGGDKYDKYYLSAGFDRNLANLQRNQYDRVTLNLRNTLQLFNRKLELSTAISFTQSNTGNNNNGLTGIYYPYASLADASGNPLAVPSKYSLAYSDTVGQGRLQDWHDRPLQNLRAADNKTSLLDYHINNNLAWHITKEFDLSLLYQYNRGQSSTKNNYSLTNFYARDLVNQYTQVDPGTGALLYKIPLGGILDDNENNYYSHNARLQASYQRDWQSMQELNVLAGTELRDIHSTYINSRLYGYDQSLQTSLPVDMVSYFPLYYQRAYQRQVPDVHYSRTTINRFLSYFGNIGYTYRHRYTLTASVRRDESNIFGVAANQRGVPLWSAGAAWEISRENFYKVNWLTYLRFRFTNGYSGNVNNSVSAYTTASYGLATNLYGAQQASIDNPPNPELRWEKIHTINWGLDFATKNNHLNGSIEWYNKSGADLIAPSQLDPTTGVARFTGNTANMSGKGLDMTLSMNVHLGALKWTVTVLYNYNIDKVTSYKLREFSNRYYAGGRGISPTEGRPLYSVYSFAWAGLNASGDPQGIYQGKISTDYSAILNANDISELQYKGPANPVHFGSLRTGLSWLGFSLSVNITGKFGYYFRRPSISYYQLFYTGMSIGHPDYLQRWQKPGDEKLTNVPAMKYPASSNRDEFYIGSSTLLEKADHLRLQDLQFSYDFSQKLANKLRLQHLRLYLYANNLGIISKANHAGIDPDFVPVDGYSFLPIPRSIAAGLKIDF